MSLRCSKDPSNIFDKILKTPLLVSHLSDFLFFLTSLKGRRKVCIREECTVLMAGVLNRNIQDIFDYICLSVPPKSTIMKVTVLKLLFA